jgi:hypothetical protein
MSSNAPAPSHSYAEPSARLVIVEAGASLRDLEPPPEGCEHTVMLAQSRGEPPGAFARRVQRRLGNLAREQRRVGWSVLLLGPRADAEARSARWQIGCALNRHARAVPNGASSLALHAPAAAQAAALELMDGLRLGLDLTALSIHIRFDQPCAQHQVAPLRTSEQGSGSAWLEAG